LYLYEEIQRRCTEEGITCQRGTLSAGDYLFLRNKTILIERKTLATDFFSSLSNGRLQDQMSRAIGEGDVAILCIEGFLSVDDSGLSFFRNNRTGWRWTSVIGILSTIQLYGAFIHWIPIGHFPEFVVSQYKYWGKESHKSLVSLSVGKKSGSIRDKQKTVLMSLPGIAEELADTILDVYSLEEVLIDPTKLEKIKGIGKKKTTQIMEVIRGNSNSNSNNV
jgi:ERCC4-type nuclease